MRRRQTAAIALMLCAAAPIAIAIAEEPPLPTIFGTDGPDVINGSGAGESIYARAGDDVVNGGAGDDELDGGPGADVLRGGPGSDAVSYSGPTAVVVSADSRGGDGATGEGDNVGSDVEDIFGGDGDDRLTGNSSANTIDGGPGNDQITGLLGADSLFGGDGDDTISARDGKRDRIDCGPGRDIATVDRIDLRVNCETVRTTRSPVFAVSRLYATRGRVSAIRLTKLLSGSRVVVACYSRCRPNTSRRSAILRRNSVKSRGGIAQVRISKRRIAAGTTFEVGVRAPGGSVRCARYRLDTRMRRTRKLPSSCRTVARS